MAAYTRPWQAIAITSGTFAALNGVFAKLTTNTLTTGFSATLSSNLSIPLSPQAIEYILRIAIFALSFSLSGAMWAFYTQALKEAPSAVHANIVNTASNFLITAILGMIIFGERLPLLWWVGAAFLVSGSVVIGRREEGGGKAKGKEA